MPTYIDNHVSEVYNYARLEHDGGYNVEFRFQSIEDTLARSVVQYEAPYADGAFSDDLGASPRRIRFQAVFRGDEYANHTAFLDEVTTYKLLWSLTHPAYLGVIKGRIISAAVSHNKSVRHCLISIEFVETTDKGVTTLFISSATITQLGSKVLSEVAYNIVKITEDDDPAAPTWTADLQAKVALLKGYASSISTPVNSVAGTIRIVSGVPGELAGACLEVMEAGVAVVDTVTSLPEVMTTLAFNIAKGADYINTVINAPFELAENFKNNLQAAAVALSGIYLGRKLKDEEEKRTASLTAEQAETFDDLGRYTPQRTFDGKTESDAAFAGSEELNDVMISYADMTAAAIKLMRAQNEPEIVRLLEAQMRTINNYIIEMIEVTGNIRDVELPIGMPIFLLLNREGLPYKACRRVAALNKIVNPIFYSGKVRIYER
ncbi:MAG: DNA circularization N-terminal domain-containing protein [Deferribacteraceae bacterium]|jgi:prophage DNA circulation protein|nr:DNA circularization N-terminal domain-containing protein [Deferribacteraceae bacterium]